MEQLVTHRVLLISALIVIFAPFFAFLYYALGGKKQKSGMVSTVAIAMSLLLSLFLAVSGWNRELIHVRYDWFTIGAHTVTVGLLVNNLSLIMLVLVPLVALPVHIYSFSYMKGDTGIRRYWMYLSLFCFAMLGLVVADNLFLLYMCWELVGFASYLLIGFWYERDAAIRANKKAFLINRMGDLGFLIGLAILFSEFGTWDLVQLFGQDGLMTNVRVADTSLLTWAGLAFFLGAMAKSAQFPLHIWLPDAMEGPTSVSSLIHAATMVAAGVFMLARISPLFNDTVLLTIATVGAITALMAASIALTQRDIKKILAFSTISQLGFMMVAIGIGQVGVAIFHLVTHAFFKCLLFLCAGAVIHEMQHQKEKHNLQIDPQDIGLMGGLRKAMPYTFLLSLIAAAALAGLPLTAGYLSKDGLLIFAFEWANYQAGHWVFIPLLLMVASGMTAFYIARWLFKVFYGQNRLSLSLGKEIRYHEAPALMRWPMGLLALFCLFFVFSYNPLVFEDTWLLNGLEHTDLLQRVNIYHTVIPAAVNSVSIVLIFLAWRWYAKGKYPLKGEGLLYDWSYHQYGLNEVYQWGIVKPLLFVSGALYRFDMKVIDGIVLLIAHVVELFGRVAAWIDRSLVDGAVNGVGNLAQGIGKLLRNGRRGNVQRYLLGMLIVFLLLIMYANFI